MDGVFWWDGESLRPLTGGANREGHQSLAGKLILEVERIEPQGGAVGIEPRSPVMEHCGRSRSKP